MKNIKYYTISETADILGLSSQTLRRWDKNGKFKSQRHPINNYRIYTEEQINALVSRLAIKDETNYYDKSLDNYSPFFKSKYGSLYQLDAIKFLKSIPNSSVDLVFADPPYNIKKAEWDTFESQQQYIEWSLKWIWEAQRILTDRGSLYICGFSEILADLKWAANHLFKGCKWLVWFYRNKANMGNDWGRSHESILHFRKSKNFIYNIDEVRIPYNEHTLKYPNRQQAVTSQYGNGKKYKWSPNPKGAKPKDVFEIPTISNKAWEKYKHPTQKPVELLKKIIQASSNEDSLIVDSFGGSGTTFAVAEAFKREWCGCELNSEYCEVIKKRINDNNHIKRILTGIDQKESQKRRKKLRGAI
ncbi:MAG: MerR family transcriptional regulator [Candidatus Cloacimonetes bacterium]|nr:MerR family transcriptional regulator [Candidatus Cloacimonadota bacterium]